MIHKIIYFKNDIIYTESEDSDIFLDMIIFHHIVIKNGHFVIKSGHFMIKGGQKLSFLSF